MKLIGVFPGQGSQCLGMLKKWYQRYPKETSSILDEMDDIVQFKLSDCLLDSTSDDAMLLHETAYTQPALLTQSILIQRILKVYFYHCYICARCFEGEHCNSSFFMHFVKNVFIFTIISRPFFLPLCIKNCSRIKFSIMCRKSMI